eukprot:1407630-Alexandrium_andersonii.AAC.1
MHSGIGRLHSHTSKVCMAMWTVMKGMSNLTAGKALLVSLMLDLTHGLAVTVYALFWPTRRAG